MSAPRPIRPAKAPRVLSCITWDQLGPVTANGYLVKGWIQTGTLGLIVAESGAGKTFLAAHLGLSVARGVPFFGRRVRQAPVLYVAAEGSHGLRNRLAAYRQRNPDTAADVPFVVCAEPVNLMHVDDRAALAHTAKFVSALYGSCGLIVVDTLARSMIGDENKAEDMAAAIAGLESVRATTGAAIIVVHHLGKDAAKGARGHSSLRAAVDTEIIIESRDSVRIARTSKQRDLELGPEIAFELESVTLGSDDDGDAITSCVIRPIDSAAIPPQALRRPSGSAQRQLLAELERRMAGVDFLVWTLGELREIGRGIGLRKESARDAAVGLSSSGWLKQTVGGVSLAFPPQGAKRANGGESPDSPRAVRGEKGVSPLGDTPFAPPHARRPPVADVAAVTPRGSYGPDDPF